MVQIAAEGFKLSQRVLRKLVPIYEEGAVDDDLLNEGRRNIQNHLQTLGYFEATVTVSQHSAPDGKNLQVVYAVNPGDRHKLAAIRISGNRFFLRRPDSRPHAEPAGRTPVQSRALQRGVARRGCAQYPGSLSGERLPAGRSH